MKPKLIKTKREYQTALARIDTLMDARPGTSQGDELELLVALVEMYEDRVYPIGEPDPLEAIRFRMEQQGLKPRDLVSYIGSRSKVSEVLAGHRGLSLRMIRGLATGLKIPANILVQESTATYRTASKRGKRPLVRH